MELKDASGVMVIRLCLMGRLGVASVGGDVSGAARWVTGIG